MTREGDSLRATGGDGLAGLGEAIEAAEDGETEAVVDDVRDSASYCSANSMSAAFAVTVDVIAACFRQISARLSKSAFLDISRFSPRLEFCVVGNLSRRN